MFIEDHSLSDLGKLIAADKKVNKTPETDFEDVVNKAC
jgi:hypothetical protein